MNMKDVERDNAIKTLLAPCGAPEFGRGIVPGDTIYLIQRYVGRNGTTRMWRSCWKWPWKAMGASCATDTLCAERRWVHMDVRREIAAYAAEEDRPALLWLFSKFHWQSEWLFVADCMLRRYGTRSYEAHRIWSPTVAGRILYAHRDEYEAIRAKESDE